ncbi:MAG: tetratricopeptide repeat protein [Pseudanabaena sp. CAN_BIN31]|nr:tetratricopeptide repeat protein [Pseudanabaena sp. CAN_BIN31]
MNEPKFNVDAQDANIGVIGDNAQVTQNIYVQSADYQKLIEEIRDTKESLEDVPESKRERRWKLADKLQELEKQLEEFKSNVFKLYETFTKIEINTERLRQAKAYFDKGEFREADAVLKAEEMASDLDKLIARDQQLDRQKDNVRESREQIANEFVIKARLWATFYDEPNRLQQTCEYFEEALRASRTGENLFEYAYFLNEHYKVDLAKSLYQEALQIYRELANQNRDAFLPDVANTLNNLGLLHSTNEIEIALAEYQEALQIYRELANQNRDAFLPYVAITLNNLANLHSDINEIGIALAEYQEALKIYRKLVTQNLATFLPDLAMILNNLAILYTNTNKKRALYKFQQALQIRRKLAIQYPATFLPDVAVTLNNLAILHSEINKMERALAEYLEALQIYRELANQNRDAFLPDVANTLNNLGLLHWKTDKMATALSEYQEALQIRRELAIQSPATFLPDVAETLNNLAILHSDTDKTLALSEYQEALQIYQCFARKNPATFQPKVDLVLKNIAIFQSSTNNISQSDRQEALPTNKRIKQRKPRSLLKTICQRLKNLLRLS